AVDTKARTRPETRFPRVAPLSASPSSDSACADGLLSQAGQTWLRCGPCKQSVPISVERCATLSPALPARAAPALQLRCLGAGRQPRCPLDVAPYGRSIEGRETVRA